jgi:hypothetical protein
MPGTELVLLYCQKSQVAQGLVPVGAPVCGLWPFGLVIHSGHCVTVLSNQVVA